MLTLVSVYRVGIPVMMMVVVVVVVVMVDYNNNYSSNPMTIPTLSTMTVHSYYCKNYTHKHTRGGRYIHTRIFVLINCVCVCVMMEFSRGMKKLS